MRWLLTGFEPWGRFRRNPSQDVLPWLVDRILRDPALSRLDWWTARLPVAPDAARALSPRAFDGVVSLGLDARAKGIRVEHGARNRYVDPVTRAAWRIDPYGPDYVRAGAIARSLPETARGYRVRRGVPGECGTFVCNATLFQACRELRPRRGAYFIHVPWVKKRKEGELAEALAEVVAAMLAPRPRQALL